MGLESIYEVLCLYDADNILILVYVYDPLVMASSRMRLKELKKSLCHKLPTRDLEPVNEFLSMKLVHESNAITLVRNRYVNALIVNAKLCGS